MSSYDDEETSNDGEWQNIVTPDVEIHPNIDAASFAAWKVRDVANQQIFLRQSIIATRDTRKKRLDELQELNDTLAASDPEDPMTDTWKTERSELLRLMNKLDAKERKILQEEEDLPRTFQQTVTEEYSRTLFNEKPVDAARPRNPKTRATNSVEEASLFLMQHEEVIKEFGWLRKLDDIKLFLKTNPQILCDEAVNYLIMSGISHAMSGKVFAADQVAHQCIMLQRMLDLAKSTDAEPIRCINAVINRLNLAENNDRKRGTLKPGYSFIHNSVVVNAARLYRTIFDHSVKHLVDQMVTCAQKKLEESILTDESSLDITGVNNHPTNVLKDLPYELRKCFEEQDMIQLRQVITKMDRKEAESHMERCVTSGLWIPAKTDRNTCPKSGLRLLDNLVAQNRTTEYPPETRKHELQLFLPKGSKDI